MHVKENQKISLQKGRYKEWLTLHPVVAGNVIHNYLYMLETTTKLSLLFQVLGLCMAIVVHLKNILLILHPKWKGSTASKCIQGSIFFT